MQFTVRYSLKEDIQNYLDRVWRYHQKELFGRDPQRFLKTFPKDFQQELSRAKDKKEAISVIRNYFKQTRNNKFFRQNNQFIIKWVTIILNQESKNIEQKLRNAYQQPFPFKKIKVYLTSLPICPFYYRRRWFMINRRSSIDSVIRTATHELNHFMYLYYWQKPLKKLSLSHEKSEILREALAITTNIEGNDKPAVKPLESYIKKIKHYPMKKIIHLCLNSPYLK